LSEHRSDETGVPGACHNSRAPFEARAIQAGMTLVTLATFNAQRVESGSAVLKIPQEAQSVTLLPNRPWL